MENKVFGQGGKVGETDKLNIDSIIARLLEGKFNRDGFLSFVENNLNLEIALFKPPFLR